MQIDWLTVAAQIVNFLVLVWLLQRFLYKPITGAMRRREERIAQRMADAREAREEADARARDLEDRRAEFEKRADEMLARARDEAHDLRGRLEAEIREEMEEKRARWRAHLAEERDAFAASLRRQAGRHVLDVAGRVLADYADTDLSARVVASFADRLEALDAETRDKMANAAAREGAQARVETATALDGAAKGRITRAIHAALSSDLETVHAEDAGMILGVRLTVGDYTVEWSARRYLDRLEADLGEIVDAGAGAARDEHATRGARQSA